MIAMHSLSTIARRRDGEARLESVSLSLSGGEIVALAGSASSGRRRLQSVLALADDDWEGEYVLCEHRVHELDDGARAALRAAVIGAVDRDAVLVEGLSVEENVEIPLVFKDVPCCERDAAITEVLTRLRLATIRHADVESLPPDQRRLVAIAKALVARPRLLVIEEPFANLHTLQARLLERELLRLRETGCAIVLSVVHEAECGAADRLIRIDRGRCVEVTPAARVAAT